MTDSWLLCEIPAWSCRLLLCRACRADKLYSCEGVWLNKGRTPVLYLSWSPCDDELWTKGAATASWTGLSYTSWVSPIKSGDLNTEWFLFTFVLCRLFFTLLVLDWAESLLWLFSAADTLSCKTTGKCLLVRFQNKQTNKTDRRIIQDAVLVPTNQERLVFCWFKPTAKLKT